MTLEFIALTTTRIILIELFKKLPLWAKVIVIAVASILAILLAVLVIGIILAFIWITYSFISSGVWRSLPPQVTASIVAGLFALISLLLGNSVTKAREIKSTLQLKEIETQEALLAKRNEFHIELIDKLMALTKKPNQADELLEGFYGRLYIQASSEIIESFEDILDIIKNNEENQQVTEDKANQRVDSLIKKIRQQLQLDKEKVARLYDPLRFK